MLHFKPRVEDRKKVMIRARMRGAGPERDVCILDVSSRGMLAMAADPPAHGQYIELVIGDHALVGQVKWSGTRRFGISFRDPISVFALVSGESGPITIKGREAEREKRRKRRMSAGSFVLAQKLQWMFFLIVAVGAAAVVADLAGAGLGPLQEVRKAMAGEDPD